MVRILLTAKHINYVLASSFTTETPELLANKAGTEETTQNISNAYPSDYEGRNYFGQVVKKIGDKNYILIGNETQLRAIGTDVEVTEPIWRVYETRRKMREYWGSTERIYRLETGSGYIRIQNGTVLSG